MVATTKGWHAETSVAAATITQCLNFSGVLTPMILHLFLRTTLDTIMIVSLDKCTKYEATELINTQCLLLLEYLSLDHLRRFYATSHKEVYSIH